MRNLLRRSHIIEDAPSASLEASFAQLRRVLAQRKKQEGTLTRIFWILSLCYLSGQAIHASFAWYVAIAAGMVGFGGFLGLRILNLISTGNIDNIVHTLLLSNDPRAAGPLVEAFHYTHRSKQPLILNALEQLLPELTKLDGNPLTPQQIHILTSLVVSGWEGRCAQTLGFTLAAVKALAHTGNTQSFAELERLARRKSSDAIRERIKDTILEILPLWKARLQQEQSPLTLLRPATGTSLTDPNQLLRSHQSTKQETDTNSND